MSINFSKSGTDQKIFGLDLVCAVYRYIHSYKAETLYSLGQVYKKLDKLDRSLEYLHKFKEIEEFERNNESLNKRIRLNPNDITLRLELANLYEYQGRIDQAVMILNQAVYLGSMEAEKKLKILLENNHP